MTKLERLREWRAETAIVLGSGLGSIVPPDCEKIPYSEFKELPRPRVPGHVGQFDLGKIENKNVIFAQGRIHLYEGYSALDVTAHVRVLAAVGIKQLILTNAAGTTNHDFKPGSWMMIADQINLTGTSPLIGHPSFIDMCDAYSPRLRENFQRAANKIDIELHEGVYAGVLGPQYETPAEVRMLHSLGADAIGMSTVLETIQARALGLEVAGFSCLTNFAAGLSHEPLSHEDVLAIGKSSAGNLAKLLSAAFGKST